MIDRRKFLGVAAGALAAGAEAAPRDLEVRDLTAEGDGKLANRLALYVPRHLAKGERVPLLVLLHGLAETRDPKTGVFAWDERYGLSAAYERLRRPPIERVSSDKSLLPDARLKTLNAALASQAFRGMAIACPFTPNIARQASPTKALSAYARWIVDVVVPRARKECPAIDGDPALDGVSLGGYLAAEVFLRHPEAFGVLGGVQSAYKAARLDAYAEALAAKFGKSLRPAIHLETSEQDPFCEVNRQLSKALGKRGVPHDLTVLPGAHDQPFLREAGTLEMLLWHDRARV